MKSSDMKIFIVAFFTSFVAGENYIGYHFKDNELEERFDDSVNGMVTYQTGITLPDKVCNAIVNGRIFKYICSMFPLDVILLQNLC